MAVRTDSGQNSAHRGSLPRDYRETGSAATPCPPAGTGAGGPSMSTTTRRSALGLGAVVLASFTAPALATAAACSPDTALIKLCNDLIEHVAAIDRFCDDTQDDRGRRANKRRTYRHVLDRQYELIDQIEPACATENNRRPYGVSACITCRTC